MKCVALVLLAVAVVAPSPASAAAEATVLTGVVTTKDDGLPLPGATVAIEALGLSAVADEQGRYTLNLPADAAGKTVDVKVTAAGLRGRTWQVKLSSASIAQDFALGLTFHEEITVGSRTPGAETEKAVPVDILTSQQIATTGASETSQIIQILAPSFNFPRPTISDGADSVRPATLRGLGPDHTLVLLNGKRRHQSAHIITSGVVGRGTTGVDFNALPASAIHKIEILRDGAAAQYGSDAIAGVVNVVLKSGAQPWTFGGKVGQTLGEYTDMTGASRDYSDGELTEAVLSRGFAVGGGSMFLAAEYRNRNGTNRASPDLRDQIQPGDAGNNPVPQPNHHWGDSEQRDILTFFNASFPLGQTEDDFVYAFGGWSKRDGSHGGFYRRALDARNWPQIYPLGFLPTIQPQVIDVSGTVGARGVLGSRWFWDVSAQYGRNSFDFSIVDSLNVSLGPASPTEFYSGSLIFSQFLVNADLARQMDIGLASPLNVAFGAEYRRENFQELPGEPNSYIDGGSPDQFGRRAVPGAQVFPGFPPDNAADATRNSVALYLDLEGDLHEKVRVGVAGRFEHYDDFGETIDGKLTLRLLPHKRFAIRGAISTGFRAPSLVQSNFGSVATNFITVGGVVQPVQVGTFAVESPVARAMGAQPLQPEESVNYSAGIVFTPVDQFDLTVDFYRIDLDDRVVFSGNFTGPRIEALVRPFGANGGRFFTNAIDTKTQGIDATANYRWNLGGAGNLLLSLAYNHNDNDIVGIIKTPPQLIGLENVLFDRVEELRTTCGQPKDNVRISGTLQKGGWTGVLRTGRYGEVCFPTNTPANDQTFAAKWLTDVELSYAWNKLTLVVGALNVVDTFPDPLLPVNSSFQVQTYSNLSPFGFNGRFLYARLILRL